MPLDRGRHAAQNRSNIGVPGMSVVHEVQDIASADPYHPPTIVALSDDFRSETARRDAGANAGGDQTEFGTNTTPVLFNSHIAAASRGSDFEIDNESNLLDLVMAAGGSIRLTNCLRKMSQISGFPIQTVGDYLVDPALAEGQLKKVKGFGEKCFRELAGIVQAETAFAPVKPPFEKVVEPVGLAQIESISVDDPSLIRLYPTRIGNALLSLSKAHRLRSSTIVDALANVDELSELLFKQRGIGTGSVQKFWSVLSNQLGQCTADRTINAGRRIDDPSLMDLYPTRIYRHLRSLPSADLLRSMTVDTVLNDEKSIAEALRRIRGMGLRSIARFFQVLRNDHNVADTSDHSPVTPVGGMRLDIPALSVEMGEFAVLLDMEVPRDSESCTAKELLPESRKIALDQGAIVSLASDAMDWLQATGNRYCVAGCSSSMSLGSATPDLKLAICVCVLNDPSSAKLDIESICYLLGLTSALESASTPFSQLCRFLHSGDDQLGEQLFAFLVQTYSVDSGTSCLLNNKMPSSQLLEVMLRHLDSREAIVVQMREGLFSEPPLTLEATGDFIRRTRERVRQIKRKADTKLRALAKAFRVEELLHARRELIFRAASHGADWIHMDQLQSAVRDRMCREDRYLLELVGINVLNWFKAQYDRLGPMLCANSECLRRTRKTLDECRRNLSSHDGVAAIVRPDPLLPSLHKTHPKAIADCLGFEGCSVITYENNLYVVSRDNVANRAKAIAPSLFDARFWLSTNEILLAASPANVGATVTREIQNLIRGNPTKYRHLHGFGWLSLERVRSQLPEFDGKLSPAPMLDLPLGSIHSYCAKATIENQLVEFVVEHGAVSAKQLREYYAANINKHGQGHDVGFRVDRVPHITLVAPNLYAALDDNGAIKNLPEVLRFATAMPQAKKYIQSRFAGSPMGWYPLWSTEYESEMGIRLESNLTDVGRQSLAYIANQDRWPTCAVEQVGIQRKSEHRGTYGLLEDCEWSVDSTAPSLDDVFLILLVGVGLGHINWHIANRVLGRRIEATRVISWLAILVALGAFSGPDHWQRRCDVVRSVANNMLEQLLETLEIHGKVSWGDDATANLTTTLLKEWRHNIDGVEWIDTEEMANLVLAISGGRADKKSPRLRWNPKRSTSGRINIDEGCCDETASFVDPSLDDLLE